MPPEFPSQFNSSPGEKDPTAAEKIPKAEARLHFFRHARKAGGNEVPHEEDLVMEITSQGWEESFATGERLERLSDAQTAAVGSDRLRTRQTAAAIRAAGQPNITGQERSLKELETALGETDDLSARVWINKGLAMPFTKGETHGVDRILEAYNRNEYMRESLKLHQEGVEASKPRGSSIHAKQVYGIAKIITRYARITPKLVENPTVPHAIERFLGTHGGVQESFWIELVRKLRGETEVERLIAMIPNGVGYNEGMDVDIVARSRDEEPRLRILFTVGKGESQYKFDEVVPVAVIDKVLEEFAPEFKHDNYE